MKKRLFALLISGMIAAALLTASVHAENIGGLDFDIPEEWEMYDATVDEASAQYTYTCGKETVLIAVVSIPEEHRAASNAYNDTVLSCDGLFSDYEGYYLMTNINTNTDTNLSRAQECVYKDDEWYYANLVGQNTGEYTVTLLYIAPTRSPQTQIVPFGNIVSNTIVEVQ